MKYILSLLALLLLLPSVAFGQTVQTSWTRNVGNASIYPLYVNDNVGIGTTSPWTKFAVTGSTTIAGGPLYILRAITSGSGIAPDTDYTRQFSLFRNDLNDYVFGTIENRNGGANASVDWIWDNDRTTSTTYYNDCGLNSSGYNNPIYGLLNQPNGWYCYNTDGPVMFASATTSTAGYFDVTTGGYSSSRMRITSTGNVGIGTTSPLAKLSVKGTGLTTGLAFQVTDSANAPKFTVFDNGNVGIGTTTPNSRLNVYAASGLNASFDNGISSGAGSAGSIRIGDGTISKTYGSGWIWGSGMQPDTDNDRYLGTKSTRWGYLQVGDAADSKINSTTFSTNGNVGIGTTTPNAALNVNTTLTNGTPAFRISNTSAGPTWNGLVIDSNNASSINARNWFIGANSVVYGDFNIRTSDAYGGNPTTSGTSRFYISETGSVGIGTTTPQSTLSVGSVNDATNSYAQIDSVNGAPTAGDCDTDLERGRMIVDFSNHRLYVCNGATRGWDYSALTD